MNTVSEPDTEELLELTAQGDIAARQQLLVRHRKRLRRRWSPCGSIAASPRDWTLPTSSRRRWPKRHSTWTNSFALDRSPIYAWLRQFAWERLVKLHRHHIRSKKRSVTREEAWSMPLPEDSVLRLARLVAGGASPSQALIRNELRQRLRAALDRLAPARPRDPGHAEPGAALDRRDRRGPGPDRGGRQGPSPPRLAAAADPSWESRHDRRHARPAALRQQDRLDPGRAGRAVPPAPPGGRIARSERICRPVPGARRSSAPVAPRLADDGRAEPLGSAGSIAACQCRRRFLAPSWASWATSGSSARSAAAAWASSTRPSRSRCTAGWP